eukprot:c18433_g1_i1.p1 GENE.c18433_g1_i1~~c18433_g1_i1.p1  ORF type:complete len:499 (+),score=102.63 c18433_g1_i1:31-1527(+)
MCDRGGGREVKGHTLRKSKKNPGSAAGKGKVKPVAAKSTSPISPPAPVILPCEHEQPFYDAGAALLSRQFDRDRETVLSRARRDGVAAIVGWFPDMDKIDELEALAVGNAGFVYFAAGVHPDNISKTSKHKHDGWLAKIEECAKRPECVAILSGLNLTRDVSTHYAQTSLLEASCQLADKAELPLVLHLAPGESVSNALEILRAQGWGTGAPDEPPHRRIVLHNAIIALDANATLIASLGPRFYLAVAAMSATEQASSAVNAIPLQNIVVCSDSPWQTPQNHPDEHVRSMRNEPSNLSFVLSSLNAIRAPKMSPSEFASTIERNTMSAYGLRTVADQQADGSVPQTEDDAAGENENDEESENENEQIPEPSEASDVRTATSSAPSSSTSALYRCSRCRSELFSSVSVLSHASLAPLGQDFGGGNCNVAIFLTNVGPSLVIRDKSVECASCCQKLGRPVVDGLCACGASVASAVVKLVPTKLDCTAEASDLQQGEKEGP